MTSRLYRGKADTPQTNENALYNLIHLERSNAKLFFFLTKKTSGKCLKAVVLFKTDEAVFQLEQPLALQGGSHHRQTYFSATARMQSVLSPRERPVWSLKTSGSVPVPCPSPAPGHQNGSSTLAVITNR